MRFQSNKVCAHRVQSKSKYNAHLHYIDIRGGFVFFLLLWLFSGALTTPLLVQINLDLLRDITYRACEFREFELICVFFSSFSAIRAVSVIVVVVIVAVAHFNNHSHIRLIHFLCRHADNDFISFRVYSLLSS